MARTKHKNAYFLKDFETAREEMLARLPIVSQGKLTDLNESSIATTLVEVMAAVADMLGFYLDSSALELYLPTVRQPENVYRLARLIGYRIRESSSARVRVRFTLSEAFTSSGNEVFIPKGTRLGTATGAGRAFVTTENTTIPVGRTESELVLAIQGTVQNETFLSDGTANQFITLTGRRIDPTTIEVYTGDTKWSPEESFLYSQDQDFHYVYETDYLGVTSIRFGDGKFGRAPGVGEVIAASYLTSGGEEGNVGADTVSLILSDIYTTSGIQVDGISVTNPDPAAGGSEREVLESVKLNAPGALSALYRPMTKTDYIALIQRLGGVQHVNVWGEQEEEPPSYENMNWANVCLVPTGGGLPSENLRSIVEGYLLENQPITVRLRFIDPEYVYLKPSVAVHVQAGYSQENIRIQIVDAVRSLFALENVRFGQDIRASRLYKLAMDVEGVDHVFVSDFASVNDVTGEETPIGQEVVLQKWQVPSLWDFEISVAQARELPVPDEYPFETP